jgi:hypothetical protein
MFHCFYYLPLSIADNHNLTNRFALVNMKKKEKNSPCLLEIRISSPRLRLYRRGDHPLTSVIYFREAGLSGLQAPCYLHGKPGSFFYHVPAPASLQRPILASIYSGLSPIDFRNI